MNGRRDSMARMGLDAPGPFRADQLRSGDPYELSRGHTIQCLPTGARGGRANLVGGSVLDTDPMVSAAAVDVGFTPEPGTLRAPDIAVGNIPDASGWAPGVPPLAVEYADVGQDEEKLQEKIQDLLESGTRAVWVVRLMGPRRVEVYEPSAPLRILTAGQALVAPGILQNPVPVEALYDREAAHEATLRNLLQRKGYSSLEEVAQEGRQEGRQEGHEEGRLVEARDVLFRVLARRGFSVTPEQKARIEASRDLATLRHWLEEAVVSSSAEEALR